MSYYFTQEIYDKLQEHKRENPYDVIVVRDKKDRIVKYWKVKDERRIYK